MSGPAEPSDFDAMYRADQDPWQVESSWYEQRKLAVMLASLPRERYLSAWEPGCGPGLITQALAPRVDHLIASDVSEVGVALARSRCRGLAGVEISVSALPEIPLGARGEPVELVVVAECLYYVEDLAAAFDSVWASCRPGAHVVFVHWAHHPHDAYRSGPAMHAEVSIDAMRRRCARVVLHVDDDFLLDVYQAPA